MCDISFPFSEIEKKKKKKKKHVVVDIGPEVHRGLHFTSFLWMYPRMSIFFFFPKIGLKD